LEPRLQRRYAQLVQQHLRVATPLTPGLSSLPGLAQPFASVQAAWRFYANPRVSLPALAQPLLQAARQALAQTSVGWHLLIHDQSNLCYSQHHRKTDHVPLLRSGQGYELTTALLVETHNGHPLAPVELRLRAADAVYNSRSPASAPPSDASWLDQLLPTMQAVTQTLPGTRLVHLIDRAGDSVGHYRQWAQAQQTFVVRARAAPRVRWQEQNLPLGRLAQHLAANGALVFCREVEYHGRRVRQEVAEVEVVLARAAWCHRGRRGQKRRHHRIVGQPLTLRLVVSRLVDEADGVQAEWLLLSNVPAEVPAATVALWYYWRWRIESYFKLLKSAGQQVEHWQQESAEAIAKRLAVASMACVVVWRLARASGAEASAVRGLLVRLSGRVLGGDREFTEPALLAGLWVLLSSLAAIELYGVEALQAARQQILGDNTS
jgi:hypothetical protein